MELNKHITLTVDEFHEAISEYLGKRGITFSVNELYVNIDTFEDGSEVVANIEVIAE